MTPTAHNMYIYTDGSSIKLSDRKFESSAAYIIYLDDKRYGEGGQYFADGTISEGEVMAFHLALYKMKDLVENLQGPVNIYVFSDSIYVVMSLNKWIKRWSKTPLDQCWKSSSGEPVAYQEFFKEMYSDFVKPDSPFKDWLHIYHIKSHVAKTKQSLNKARFYFMNENQIDMEPDEFRKHTDRNDEVDSVAVRVRETKVAEPFFIGTSYILDDWIDAVNHPDLTKINPKSGIEIVHS